MANSTDTTDPFDGLFEEGISEFISAKVGKANFECLDQTWVHRFSGYDCGGLSLRAMDRIAASLKEVPGKAKVVVKALLSNIARVDHVRISYTTDKTLVGKFHKICTGLQKQVVKAMTKHESKKGDGATMVVLTFLQEGGTNHHALVTGYDQCGTPLEKGTVVSCVGETRVDRLHGALKLKPSTSSTKTTTASTRSSRKTKTASTRSSMKTTSEEEEDESDLSDNDNAEEEME